MDRRVTCKFFRVIPNRGTRLSFQDVLIQAAALTLADREREIEDVRLRLEEFAIEGGYACGDFTRVQTENFPSLVRPAERAEALELPEDAGLGHSAAFRYDQATQILLLQQNRNGVSVGRLDSYLKDLIHTDGYEFEPVLTQDAWRRLANIEATKVKVRVAAPEALSSVENEDLGIKAAFRQLREIAGGAYVEATIGIGRGDELPKGRLNRLVRYLRREIQNERGGIKKMQVEGRERVGAETQHVLLDFIEAQMGASVDIDLPDDPNIRYARRKAFLAQVFAENVAGLYAQLGIR